MVRKNNYSRTVLCDQLYEFLKKKRFCDTFIKVQDEYHPCHKLILAAASPILRAIINERSEKSGFNTKLQLKMDFLTSSEVDLLMEYLYTGSIPSKLKVDSVMLSAINIFTDPKYEGMSMEQAKDLLTSQSSKSDAMVMRMGKTAIGIPKFIEQHSSFSRDIPKLTSKQLGTKEKKLMMPKLAVEIENDVEIASDESSREIQCKDQHSIREMMPQNTITFSSHSEQCSIEVEGGMEYHHYYNDSDAVEFEDGDSESTKDEVINKPSRNNNQARQTKARIKLPRVPPFLCPCQNCGKIFESHQRLRSHYRHTHGEKKYKCDICPLRFLYPKDLKSHLRTHTGEKPFVCDMCGKGFAQMGALSTHMKIHKEVDEAKVVFRPCSLCAKKYCLKDRDKNVDYLYKSNDFTGNCICPNSNCAKKFSSSKSLKRHLNSDVCNPNSYHCGKCFAKFEGHIQLRYHVGTLHCTHKRRKRVKTDTKEMPETPSRDPCLPMEPVTQSFNVFDHNVDSIMSCNIEEVRGLLQLSEEVVIKGD